ncbi:MAG: FKBP-type peptidyl-prolyl cis-trans isomerase [Thermoanaerobaculia bacterium]
MRRVWIAALAAGLVVSGAWLDGQASAEKALQIADGMKVTMEYTLTLQDKAVVDSTKGQPPFSYVHGGHQIIPGLEKALTGLKAGDKKRVTIPAADAYGLYDEKRKVAVPKKNVPPEAKPGMRLRSQDGREAKVLEIKGDSVVIDTNHPLAGKDLTFDVNILKVEHPPKAAPDKQP